MKKVRIFDKKVTKIRVSKIRVSEIRVSKISVSEIRVSKIRVSEIRVREIRVSEIRISSNHHELHGAIFVLGICSNFAGRSKESSFRSFANSFLLSHETAFLAACELRCGTADFACFPKSCGRFPARH